MGLPCKNSWRRFQTQCIQVKLGIPFPDHPEILGTQQQKSKQQQHLPWTPPNVQHPPKSAKPSLLLWRMG